MTELDAPALWAAVAAGYVIGVLMGLLYMKAHTRRLRRELEAATGSTLVDSVSVAELFESGAAPPTEKGELVDDPEPNEPAGGEPVPEPAPVASTSSPATQSASGSAAPRGLWRPEASITVTDSRPSAKMPRKLRKVVENRLDALKSRDDTPERLPLR